MTDNNIKRSFAVDFDGNILLNYYGDDVAYSVTLAPCDGTWFVWVNDVGDTQRVDVEDDVVHALRVYAEYLEGTAEGLSDPLTHLSEASRARSHADLLEAFRGRER